MRKCQRKSKPLYPYTNLLVQSASRPAVTTLSATLPRWWQSMFLFFQSLKLVVIKSILIQSFDICLTSGATRLRFISKKVYQPRLYNQTFESYLHSRPLRVREICSLLRFATHEQIKMLFSPTSSSLRCYEQVMNKLWTLQFRLKISLFMLLFFTFFDKKR